MFLLSRGPALQVRELKLRRPEVVATYGGALLLRPAGAGLPKDLLCTLLEQVALASLDTGRAEVAQALVKKLADAFPGSVRVGEHVGAGGRLGQGHCVTV